MRGGRDGAKREDLTSLRSRNGKIGNGIDPDALFRPAPPSDPFGKGVAAFLVGKEMDFAVRPDCRWCAAEEERTVVPRPKEGFAEKAVGGGIDTRHAVGKPLVTR